MMKVRLLNDGGYAVLRHLSFPLDCEGILDDAFDDTSAVLVKEVNGIRPLISSDFWFYNETIDRQFEVIDE